MHHDRFDTISKLLASRRTRRGTLAGAAGVAAAAMGSTLFAQEATPVAMTADPDDPHPDADSGQASPELLYVQPFDSGTWAPKPGEDGVYLLTLTGAAAQTIYFSDRPERIVGLLSTQQFLSTLGFTPDNPPNAAVVAQTDTEEHDILVVTLMNPVYDAATGSLTYDAHVLADYGNQGLAYLAQQQVDYELAESFGAGSLFIDDGPFDCADIHGQCYQQIDDQIRVIGDLSIGACGDGRFVCEPCNSDGKSAFYGKECAEKYPAECMWDDGGGLPKWDCFARGGGI